MGQDQLDKYLKEQLSQHQSPIDTDALWQGINVKKGQEIEAIVKDKLAHHESAIDSQAVWNNIATKVTGKPSGGWLAKSAGLLLFSILFSYSIYYFTYNNETLVTEDSSSVSNKVDNGIIDDNSLNNRTVSSTLPNSQASDISSAQSKSTNNNTSQSKNSESEINASENDNSQSHNTNKSSTNNSINRNRANNSNSISTHYDRPLSNTVISNASNKNNSKINKTGLDNTISKSLNRTTYSSPTSSATTNSDNKSSNAILTQAYTLNTIENSYLKKKTPTAADFLGDLPSRDECFAWNKSIECYDYSPKKFHFSILAYTSADYYRKSMSAESGLAQNYLSNRKETQKAQISNRSGLLIKLRHRKGLYVKFGAEAGFLRERFSHQTRDTITEIVPNQLINVDIDINGDTTLTYGNAPVTTISSKNWRVNNLHRTIGIPILIGYEKKLSKFNIGMELGVLYNIHRSFEGWLLGPPDAPSDAKDYFTSSNDLNLTGGFNITYELNKRYSLVGLATFRQNMNRINNESINGITQKNTTFGLGVGLEIKI